MPREWADRYRGRFDMGYEAAREQILARQTRIGHRPRRHRAPADQPDRHSGDAQRPRGPAVPALDYTKPWDDLSDDERRLFARMAEVYAGFLSHADAQIGRLLDYLESIDQLDNTLVFVVSDNGASGEGGPDGSVNENKFFNGIPDDLAANLAMIDELGGPQTYNHYPTGWAMAFNTPFKMWKRYSFNGGSGDPCIVSWPAGIPGRGEVRDQYHHAHRSRAHGAGVPGPGAAEGRAGGDPDPDPGRQHGVSFASADTPSTKRTVILDARHPRDLARRLEGGHHPPGPLGVGDYAHDTWELYHVETDRSELHDLAAEEPDRLAELIGLWFYEAGVNHAFPLDDRSALEIILTPRPQLIAPRDRYVTGPARRRSRSTSPSTSGTGLRHRSPGRPARRLGTGRAVRARQPLRRACALRQGQRLHYVNNFVGVTEQRIDATEDLPTGRT